MWAKATVCGANDTTPTILVFSSLDGRLSWKSTTPGADIQYPHHCSSSYRSQVVGCRLWR